MANWVNDARGLGEDGGWRMKRDAAVEQNFSLLSGG
jgi:hypothetical protein